MPNITLNPNDSTGQCKKRLHTQRPKLRSAALHALLLLTAALQVTQFRGNRPQFIIVFLEFCRFCFAGITVNCVAPGWIDTESLSDHERAQGASTPLRRCGTSREIASCVQWLASESASYITGQTVSSSCVALMLGPRLDFEGVLGLGFRFFLIDVRLIDSADCC
jgi:hypothetical protein